MSNNSTSSGNGCDPSTFLGLLNCASSPNAAQTPNTLKASIIAAFSGFGIQFLAFILLRLRLTRIYVPRSYLVPKSQRVPQPPRGLIGWLYPIFTTTNLTLIQRCGLDAYFFLRYLRLLLKIFLPTSILVLPILLPINQTGGGDQDGLFAYSIQNVSSAGAGGKLWAHLILAVLFIFWVFYVVFTELRGYVRVRQAYLTSPQHRIRASATTVLVAGIPNKWLTFEALSGLYDVFPGGIRNIWINRNYDELSKKVKQRDSIARQLESAETSLIVLCHRKNAKAEKKRAKAQGGKRKTREEKKQDQERDDKDARKMAEGRGVSAGEQHEVSEGMQEILETERRQHEELQKSHSNNNPFGLVGQGLGAVGQGLGQFGKGFGKLGGRVIADVDNNLIKTVKGIDHMADEANTSGIPGLGASYVDDDSLYRDPTAHASDSSLTPEEAHPGRDLRSQFPKREAKEVTAGLSVQLPPQKPNPFASNRDSYHAQRVSPTGSDGVDHGLPSVNVVRPSSDTRPAESLEIQEPHAPTKHNALWSIFGNNDRSLAVPSPRPHVAESDDEFPLSADTSESNDKHDDKFSKSKMAEKVSFGKQSSTEAKIAYPEAMREDLNTIAAEEQAVWRNYISEKDRATKRLPIRPWLFALPFMGKKVDKIYYLRGELARLNTEIEADQNETERFPLMNSAFIQFNHQIAAHMCCQSLNHHAPLQMAPRIVEISPGDVIWDNMAVKWWERYLRFFLVLLACAGMTVLWAAPVAFTSVLNKVTTLSGVSPWLTDIANSSSVATSIIQGVLPPVLLSLILLLAPLIFRALITQQGVPTGTIRELGVQKWYFAFLFILVFLLVSLVNGITTFLNAIADNPISVPSALAQNLPGAATYFYSYLIVQALGNSAGALLQTFTLFMWFVWASIADSTARDKFKRQTQLSTVEWGSFFPVFTNFAVIGIIYSMIAPLILVFMLFIFALFWIVYRFNVLYVNAQQTDTGGRLFPVAINQLFVGIYFLELCLIGLFFTLTTGSSFPQGGIMIAMLIITAVYQILLNSAFAPFFEYLPITLEDEAVMRDAEFARIQAAKFNHSSDADKEEFEEGLTEIERHERKLRLWRSSEEKRSAEDPVEGTPVLDGRSGSAPKTLASLPIDQKNAWHTRARQPFTAEGLRKVGPDAVARLRYLADGKRREPQHDTEAQKSIGDVLYGDFAEDLEDLAPEDRDLLVRYAFQHSALRARRPVVWIPRDKLGVSDDEIRRTKQMSTVEVDSQQKTAIWMSNDGTALDHKGRVVFRKSPPDFSNVDLVVL
ncbi:DUF221-domain-containing protein [Dissoconium aciculare CBS 342.82]|uniref:DUF221-domain-containing protein n=1 Tax=Dissoconium aciculare CBS 342.82 TaxID=1314786 RepID=A0A6J3MGF2_9PEZI|nr:DUF221-domain-containing protein [Dissoconium aciculare CBS 342.82]KAF1826943.1 DUF221-domain-containing protein [Dissoconium aciculare CBS 342.82]